MTRSEHGTRAHEPDVGRAGVGVAAIVLGATLAAGRAAALAGGPTVGEPQPEL